MALYLSVDEAVDQVNSEADAAGAASAVAQSLGAVGAYFIHACELSNFDAGELISDCLGKDEKLLLQQGRSIS